MTVSRAALRLAERLAGLPPEQRDYTLRSLPSHLAAAGRGNELRQALTTFQFAQAKLTALGPTLLAADYKLASGPGLGLDEAEAKGLGLIGDAMRLSAPILADRPDHLAAQLLARMAPADGPSVAEILEQAGAGPGEPWLRPLRPSLSRAGGPLRYVLRGHKSRVRDIAVTRDGRRAVSAADDHILRVWDLANGTALVSLRGHTDQIFAVAVTPDGSLAVSGSNDRTVRIWDLASGGVRRVLRGHEAYIKAVAVTADGELAISVAADGTIVWDLASGQTVVRRPGHGGYMSSVALLPDGRHALSPDDDHSLRLWEVRTGEERAGGMFVGHASDVNTIAAAPDGRRVVSGSLDGRLILWDLDQAAPLGSWQMDEWAINRVAYLPDGERIIAVGESSTVIIWDLESGAPIWQWKDGVEGIKAVAATADGALALTGAFDNAVKVWNLPVLLAADGQRKAPESISAVACAGSYAFTQKGQAMTAWDVASAGECLTLLGYRFLAAAPSVGRALLISPAQELELWDLGSATTVCPLPGDRPATFLPGGREVIVSLAGGALGRYRTSDGAYLGELSGHSGTVTDLVVSDDGRLALSAGEDGTVRLWDLADAGGVGNLKVGRRKVTALGLTGDARYAAVGLDNGRLVVWPTREGRFSRGIRWLRATGGAMTDSIQRVALQLGSALKGDVSVKPALTIPGPGHRAVTAPVLTADDRRAVTAGRGGIIRVWSLERGKVLHTLEHEAWEDAAILPDGSFVVVHSLNSRFGYGRRQVWDLSTGALAGELPSGTLLPKAFLRTGMEGGTVLVEAVTAVIRPEVGALKRFWEPEFVLNIWDLEYKEAALSFVGDFDWTDVSVAADGLTVVAGDSVGQVHFLRMVT